MEKPQFHNDALSLVQNKIIICIYTFFYLVDCCLYIKGGNALSRNLYKYLKFVCGPDVYK